jgi:hypothetical protein
MNFKHLLRAISFMLVMALVLIATQPAVSRTRAQTFSATLTPLAGLVQILPVGRTEWVNVTENILVNQGDQVRTGSNGIARLNVLTGIEVDIYNVSQVELFNLSVNENTGAFVYNLFQILGAVYVKVDQRVTPDDTVRVVLPLAGIAVEGTRWYNFVTPKMNLLVMGAEDQVRVTSATGRLYEVNQDEALWIALTLPTPLPLVCSDELLDRNVGDRYMSDTRQGNDVTGLREYFRDEVVRNVNPEIRNFLADELGIDLNDERFMNLNVDDEEAILRELLDKISEFDAKGDDLKIFLGRYRVYLEGYWEQRREIPIPATTCGNNVEDPGETAENCENDFNFKPYCGNGLCENDRFKPGVLGESMINCPEDCRVGNGLDRSCAVLINGKLPPITPPTGGGGIVPPTPSGIGN